MSEPEIQHSSPKAKALAARLMAVQALYQATQRRQPIADAAAEYLAHRAGMEIEGEKMVMPDGALFKKILKIAEERQADIEALITANITRDAAEPIPEDQVMEGTRTKKGRDFEPLLKAVLSCAVAELLTQDIDYPIIINDYLNVAHEFYGPGEVGLINAILDGAARALRS